jgi:tetratricopeptide (TPR) repeat protein
VIRFIENEMSPQRSKLEAEISETQGNVKVINKLGVLYARYGLYEEAEGEFEKVLKQREYAPALINLGNLYFINEEMKKAREYYLRAGEVLPDNPKVLLSLARVDHALEDYESARGAYGRLRDIDPSLASRFAYLESRGEESARAAEATGMGGVVIWEEE